MKPPGIAGGSLAIWLSSMQPNASPNFTHSLVGQCWWCMVWRWCAIYWFQLCYIIILHYIITVYIYISIYIALYTHTMSDLRLSWHSSHLAADWSWVRGRLSSEPSPIHEQPATSPQSQQSQQTLFCFTNRLHCTTQIILFSFLSPCDSITMIPTPTIKSEPSLLFQRSKSNHLVRSS